MSSMDAYVRHISSTKAYVIYVNRGRDTIAIILHDIGMCRELEWHRSRGLCMCLIIHRVINVVCLLDCYAIYYLH